MDELPLSEYFSVLKRRYQLFAITFGVLLIACTLVTATYSSYQSTATVEIEESEIPENIAATAGNNTNALEALADLRISRLQQKVTSTGSLIEIITKFNLYSKERASTPIDLIADTMRKKIKLNLVSSLLANPASAQKASAGQLSAIAFTLSFSYDNPLLAQQVTNELITRFLDEDLKQRRSQAEETSAFLGQQIKQLESAISEQEKKIAEYKQESGDMRPEALMFNQQAAASVTMSLQNIESQIASTEGNIGALHSQLSAVDPYSRAFADGTVLASPALQLKALQTQHATLSAQYGRSHPDVIKVTRQIKALKGQVGTSIDQAELNAKITDIAAQLATSQQTYGSENPDVQSLKRQLTALQTTKTARNANSESSDFIKADADNPAYLSIVAQLRSAEGQRKGLDAQRASLLEQQEKYRKAVTGNPIVEQQMASLTRDYENAQMRYRELKAKKMAADMSQEMERDRKGQKMSVIDPPELPLKTKPPRLLLLLGGLIISIMGGLGSVIFMQLLNQSVRGPHHLASLVGVPPLTSIPYLRTQEETYRLDRNKRYIIGFMALVLIILAAILSVSLMPLDTVWSALTGSSGL